MISVDRIKQWCKSVERSSSIPGSEKMHNNLGAVLAASERVDEAIAHYPEAFRTKLDYYCARVNLALALEKASRSLT